MIDRRTIFLGLAVFAGIALASFPATSLAAEYQPMFSPDFLRRLDPESRERFAALEAENRRRWENRNPQAPDPQEALSAHEQTQLALRRIEESRALAAARERRDARAESNRAKRKAQCDRIAAEIESMKGGGVFYEENPATGERVYLGELDVRKRVNTLEKRYKESCLG
ncbi:MAG: hypothetical protein AAF515_12610 [Pseudomonadota bacterium]